ncbi:MAG: UpxY family transcription antiterminator [Chitinophagaceae bacterium]
MVEKKWHAVYTRPGKEKRVAGLFDKKKIANYVPVYKTESVVDGRKKVQSTPLFPQYVFVSADSKSIDVLKQSGDIINYVYWLGSPVVIENEEINAMKLFLNEYSCTRVEKTRVRPGEQFTINNELQLFRKGNLIEANVATVKLTVSSMGHVLIAEVRKEKAEEFAHAKDSMIGNIVSS